MLSRLAADAVLLLHLGFIAFALLGGLFAARWPRAMLLHLPAAAWAAFIALSGRICPLTHAENYFRAQAGQAGYAESFIEHYLLALIYPTGLTRDIQFILAGVVVALNVAIYVWVWRRRRVRPSQAAVSPS